MEFKSEELGVVLTPSKTAGYIVSRLGEINEGQKILDPCVGPGIFIKKLLELGINKKQIFTFDIVSNFKNQIENLGVYFKKQDTLLALYPDSYNEFDFIIGNPPYLNKASTYVRKNKVKLRRIYGKINAHETYAMFIVNSIWRLKEGGKLGFITSNSFLTLSTHKRLRRFILNNCKIDEILLAPKNLFSNQNVSINPVILILTKCAGQENKKIRESNIMRIIPKVESEDDYKTPTIINEIKQIKYNSLPFNIFYTDVEDEVIGLFEKAPKLEKYLKGYIGMHTHNNKKYIAAIDDTELAEIFKMRNLKILDSNKKYKIIESKALELEKWKPYLKRGGADQYYRPIMEALDWNEGAINNYDIPKKVPFEEEGIIISGVSSRLAARYMPKGCYWDSNKAIGFIMKDKSVSIQYYLGLLNSSLYNYLAKGIINNTSSIQITGIHVLPVIKPENEIKEKIEILVTKIIKNKQKNFQYDYTKVQKEIDDIIFGFYAKKFKLTNELKKKLDDRYSIYSI
ncbi:MAG: Eco57I restriction-modification methylase domain-containing protein [Promethearchaeota archaeon]